MPTVIHDVTCTACGCLCDDVCLEIEGDRIIATHGACGLGEELFLNISSATSPASVNGDPVELPFAIDEASRLLVESKSLLVCGLAHSDVATQRVAVELAERLGATIDPALAPFHRDALVAMQNVGVSTCTLGEVGHRADVIVIWGADPAQTHPRLFERFIDPPGKFVPGGRGDRRVLALDSQETETSRQADQFIQVGASQSIAVLSALRMAVRGLPLTDGKFGELDVKELQRLASDLQSAQYSVFFFGPRLSDTSLGQAIMESLMLLVRELNSGSRCAALGLGGPVAENVLTWQTGYPCGVNFAAGYPRYDPWQYSTNTMLERGEVDVALLIGRRGFDDLSAAARCRLEKIYTIFLNFEEINFPQSGGVRIDTSTSGVHNGGTMFRMDGVPLPLREVLKSSLPSEADVLSALLKRVVTSK